MIDAIIFDAEGVVIDSEALWDRSQEEFLRCYGFSYERDRIKHLITGKSLLDGVKIMQKIYGLKGEPKELERKRKMIIKEIFRSKLKFISGFKHFFEEIRKAYKTCIATSMDKELLEIADKKLGLSELFNNNIFSIADVNFISKPNPDIFLYAAEKLGSQPTCCLVIEDAPYGIEAAKMAGMKCIALTTTYNRDRLMKADLVVDSFSKITTKVLLTL